MTRQAPVGWRGVEGARKKISRGFTSRRNGVACDHSVLVGLDDEDAGGARLALDCGSVAFVLRVVERDSERHEPATRLAPNWQSESSLGS